MTSLWIMTLLVGVAWGRSFSEPDWGFQSYLNVDFTLECNHSTLIVEPFNYVQWELPNGQLVTANTDKYTLYNGDDGQMNMKLTVKGITEMDAGVYQCHVYSDQNMNTKRGSLLRGLNYGGHMYMDPFDEYRNNVMIAGIAAACFCVPLIALCFVYKFRFQSPEDRREKHQNRDAQFQHRRYMEENGDTQKGTELSTSKNGNYNQAYENGEDRGPTHL